MRDALTIAGHSLREAVRRRVLLVVGLLTLVFLGLYRFQNEKLPPSLGHANPLFFLSPVALLTLLSGGVDCAKRPLTKYGGASIISGEGKMPTW